MAGELINITGKKFGRLTAIKRIGSYPNRTATWLCKCDCGTEKIVNGYHLRQGHTRSCGCLSKEVTGNLKRLSLGLASMRASMRQYKKNATNRKLGYNLTENEFKEITQKDCHYCGAEPNNISKDYKRNGEYKYNGIDRIDNSKGYTIDNIVPCCRTCNSAKGTKTIQEFKSWVINIYSTTINKKGDTNGRTN